MRAPHLDIGNHLARLISILLLLVFATTFSVYEARAALYSFTSHTFTPCGATGRLGPSSAQCATAYSATSWAANSSYFQVVNSGKQYWTVPASGLYRIAAFGAKGGDGDSARIGGAGAKVQGDVQLREGEHLYILPGQMGGNAGSGGGGGGGGGTYVVNQSEQPVMIAGGGGGGGSDGATGDMTGAPGAITTSGTSGRDGLTAGGSAGSGGASGTGSWSGGSGGGLLSSGGYGSFLSTGGDYFLSTANGGIGYSSGRSGGYGGGGASNGVAAGGGGGYSGGGSDWSNGGSSNREGAGGGGSFISGANQVAEAGANNAAGYVTITFLGEVPSAPTIGTATTISDSAIAISFSAPVIDNGESVTTYTAVSLPGSFTASVNQAGSGTIVVTGLASNTAYRFRVTASNSRGTSLASNYSNFATTFRLASSVTVAVAGNVSHTNVRAALAITASANSLNGRVTFFANGKRIPNCINKLTSSFIATCTWRPTVKGSVDLHVEFVPTNSSYQSSRSQLKIAVIGRSNLR
jgi:hypothetical protein